MSKKTVLAFGEVMMRLMVPDYKKLSQSRNLEYIFSGTGVNILGGLHKFGHNTKLLTKLPDNSLGESAKSFIASLGIDTSEIVMGDNYLGIYFLEKGFGIRGSKVTYSDRLSSSFCRSVIEDYDIDKTLENIDVIHFCGISLAVTVNVRNIVLNIMYKAKEKGIKIVFDCNFRSSLWNSYDEARELYREVLSYADIVFAGEMDAIHILSYETDKLEQKDRIEHLLTRMAKEFDIELICGTVRESDRISRQTLSSYIIGKKDAYFSKRYEFDVYDRIGTGDAFAAGIIDGVLKSKNINEIAEFAVCSAVLAHTSYGDTPICTVDEIESLKDNKILELSR